MSFEESEVVPKFPFSEQPGKEIGRGWSESRVLEHGEGWVVKETYRDNKNSLEKLKANKEDYEYFKTWFGDQVPETQFIRGHNSEGKAVNILRQRRIRGRSLRKISDEEWKNNETAQKNLVDFFKKCIGMWDTDDRIPDLCGPRKGKSKLFTWYPRYAPNIVLEEETNKVYLVDISAPKNEFSKEANFLDRKRCDLIVSQMKKFISENE